MPRYLNQFASPTFIEETVLDQTGGVVGTVRLKPSSVLWRPLGQHKFYSVSLDAFAKWITDPKTKATRPKK